MRSLPRHKFDDESSEAEADGLSHGSSKKTSANRGAAVASDRPIEIIYVTIKGHTGDFQKGKKKWKDDIYKDIEKSIRAHPIYSMITNICVVVSEVNAEPIRQLAAYLDLNNISRSKDFINRKISAPTTTKKLLGQS